MYTLKTLSRVVCVSQSESECHCLHPGGGGNCNFFFSPGNLTRKISVVPPLRLFKGRACTRPGRALSVCNRYNIILKGKILFYGRQPALRMRSGYILCLHYTRRRFHPLYIMSQRTRQYILLSILRPTRVQKVITSRTP